MQKSTTTIALLIAIIVVLNLVSEQYFFRIDLTEDNQYTLSDATKKVLKSLEEPVTVKAYFSEDLPSHVANVKTSLEEFLVEYGRLSNDNLVFEFINPNEDEEIEQQAQQAGVSPVMLNVREKDQIKQQKAYLGAVLELGEQKEVIPFMQPSTPLEYALTTAIKKMAVLEKPTIGFVQGHGEPPIEEMYQAASGLRVLYDLEPLFLSDSTPIPEYLKTLALIRPSDSLSFGELQQLEAFIKRGGNLFLGLNSVSGDFQTSSGSPITTGLESWLATQGILVEGNFVIDASCGAVQVQQQQGMFRYMTNVEFPFMPVIKNFADHPITKGLEAMILQFVSPLQFIGDSSKRFTPLAFSSEVAGSLRAPQNFNIQKQWTKADFPMSSLVVAGVLEQKTADGKTSRIMVVGDGDFAVNGPQRGGQQLQPDNVSFLVNGIDWLSDDTGLIELRTKGISYRPLDELEDGTRALLKWINFLLPILLVIGYGLFRMQMNRNKRIGRMEETYG